MGSRKSNRLTPTVIHRGRGRLISLMNTDAGDLSLASALMDSSRPEHIHWRRESQCAGQRVAVRGAGARLPHFAPPPHTCTPNRILTPHLQNLLTHSGSEASFS